MLFSFNKPYVCFRKICNTGLHHACVCGKRAVIKEAHCVRITITLWLLEGENLTTCLLEGVWFENDKASYWIPHHLFLMKERDPFTQGSGLDVNRSVSLFPVNLISIQESLGSLNYKTKEKASQRKFPKGKVWERNSVGRRGKKRRKN